MSSSERLREAATRLREVAEAATPGPWPTSLGTGYMFGRDVGSEIGKTNRPSDATFITTMHPPVALSLADWLDNESALVESVASHPDLHGPLNMARLDLMATLADAILGGDR